MPEYPIVYHNGFVLFWGSVLSITLVYLNDLLYTAYALSVMLMLISHEHAHAAECIKHSVPITSIEFSFWGGVVHAEIERHPGAAVDILLAGVRDTFAYGAGFIALLAGMYLFGPLYANGHVWITIPIRDYLWWTGQFAILTFIANIIPGTIYWWQNTVGPVRTDGWAAYKFMEIRSELWNDGKVLAISTR